MPGSDVSISGSASGRRSGPFTTTPTFNASALAFVRRKTPLSNTISSGATTSLNQTLSYSPSVLNPDARPKLPLSTNSEILLLKTCSGSTRRVSAPVRKLWRRLASGQALVSLESGRPVPLYAAGSHGFV